MSKQMKFLNVLMISFTMILLAGCSSNKTQRGSAGQASEIRVLCYNIHHANPPSKEGLIDMNAIAAVIKNANPDLVALQEVDVNTTRSGSSLNQAEELARLTGMKAYFGKAIDYGGGGYGVAILSKYPMSEMKTHSLPSADGTNGEPRVVAVAEIRLPNGKQILFASTHLDAQRAQTNRLLQINRIGEIFKDVQLPMIIAGDFNADPTQETVTILDTHFTRTCKIDCGFTIPNINPRKTIDYIAFTPESNFKVIEHKVINEEYASDHLPVFSRLELTN